MVPQTPAQHAIARRGIPVGVAMTLVFGAIGLWTDSTFAGVLAGFGFMMIIAGIAFRRQGGG